MSVLVQSLRGAGLPIVMGLVIVVLLIQVVHSAPPSNGAADEVVARTFRVVDSKGNTAIRLSSHDSGQSEIVMFDSVNPGTARIRLELGPFSTPSIQLLTPQIAPGGEDVGSTVTIKNEGIPGVPEITLTGNVKDVKNCARITIRVPPNGIPEVLRFDSTGTRIPDTK